MANRIIFFLLGMLLFNANLCAQEKVDLGLIDAKTYQYYLNKNYDSVKFYFSLSKKNDIDFYYLRMRIGILEYEKQQYFRAIVHFKKALEFFPTDTIAQEYLYFSYVFTNRSNEAEFISKNFSNTMKKRLDINENVIADVSIDFTYGHSDVEDLVNQKKNRKQINFYDETEGIAGELITNAGVGFRFHPRVKATIGSAIINIQNRKFAFDAQIGEMTTDFNTRQYQFYAKPEWMFNKGWLLHSGFSVVISQQKYPLFIFEPLLADYVLRTIDYNDYHYVGFVGVQRYLNNFKFYTGASAAWLYEQWHVQPDFRLVYFPLQNMNLYFGGTVSYHWTDSAETPIYQALAGFKIFNKGWLEGNYFYSPQQMNYYIPCQSLAVNDYSGKLTDKWNASFFYLISTKFSFNLQFAYQQLQTPQWIYNSPTQYYSKFLTYQLYSFKGGLIWKF